MRIANTDEELELFSKIRLTASPRDFATPPRRESDRIILLFDEVGCGLAARSSLADSVTIQIYVRPEVQRQGIGTELWQHLHAHAKTFNRPYIISTVDEQLQHGFKFARHRGLNEVDREIEARRVINNDQPPAPLPGIEVVTINDNPQLLEEVWFAIGKQGYEDMPTPSRLEMTLQTWLDEEASIPEASFVAIEAGEIVGYVGMLEEEHGLTCVAPTHRGRGLATHLKQHQIAWAAKNGISELTSYTQGINLPMQRVNQKLGYSIDPAWLKLQGPIN